MAVQSDEYVKITISNGGILTSDGKLDKGMLGKWDSHLDRIKKGVQSATNYNAYINNLYKKIDHDLGRAEESLFIRAPELENVQATINRINTEIFGEEDTRRYTISTEKAKMFQFKRKRAGKVSQSLAEEVVTDKLGGTFGFASAKDKQKEKVTIGLFATESEISSMGGEKEASKQLSKNLNQELKRSTQYSSLEVKNRKEAEEKKQLKEKEKKDREIKKAEEKKKRDDERKIRQEKSDAEKRERKEKADKKTRNRKLLHFVGVIVTALGVVADITRRILTTALKNASKEERDAVKAHTLGMSSVKYRGLRYQDTAHGLEEGTTANGIADIQSKFGDVTNIDEKSLSVLARVMGTEVAELVRTGMGGKEPDKLFENIINKFFNNFLQGKNSLGQSVGKEQALRELTTVLNEVSPAIASVFARMGDEYLYGINKGKFTDYTGFMGLHTIYNSGNSPIAYIQTKELGQATDDLIAKFQNLKDNVLDKLSEPLSRFISWASKLDVGKGAEDIIVDHKKAFASYADEEVRFEQMMKDTASQANVKFTDKEIKTYMKNTEGGKLDKKYKTAIMNRFRKAGHPELGALYIRAIEMRKQAIEGKSENKNYSPIDFSEGTFLGGLEEIKDIKDFSKEEQTKIGGYAFDDWTKALFGGNIDVDMLKKAESYGAKVNPQTKYAMKALAIALNNVAGKNIDFSKDSGANDLSYDTYKSLVDAYNEVMNDTAISEEEKAKLKSNLFTYAQKHLFKGNGQNLMTTSMNASIKRANNEYLKNAYANLVASNYEGWQTAEATVKDGFLTVIIKDAKGTKLGEEKKEWKSYAEEENTKLYVNKDYANAEK